MRYKDETVIIDGIRCKQINKTVARRLFNAGVGIFFHACNMRLNNMWQRPQELFCDSVNDFDYTLSSFTRFNCCKERGKYANFFVRWYE